MNEKSINYTLVTPTPRPEEQKPKVFDIKVNYETVDHLKTEEVRPISCVRGEVPTAEEHSNHKFLKSEHLIKH